MRSIASGYSLSKCLNEDLKVYWFKEKKIINSRYEKLFKYNGKVEVVDIDYKGKLKKQLMRRIMKEKNGVFDKIIKKIIGLAPKVFNLSNFDTKYFDRINIDKIRNNYLTIINSQHEFFEVEKETYKELFRPKDSIYKEIRKKKKSFDSKTIGIHIRRKDHIPAKRGSPIKGFVKTMKREIRLNNANFYLATDKQKVKKRLKKEFKDRVRFANVNLSRKHESGIKGALVDLYCLSECQKIYGSQASTFSEVASKIGNISLIRVSRDLAKSFKLIK
ncbi:hypothetical protein [Salinibacter ruber]|uniref:hypothetical protein n=1 Tax=Salinibacter ruber TaxID=146919 RepID=UPI002072CFB7|nr:hypothetical protein [Salinibacter ruber]